MATLTQLARPEIAALRAYIPAAAQPGLVRLNANEAPWRSAADAANRALNLYPPARPDKLRNLLAGQYDVVPAELMVTRGTSEAIDLLIRAFCRPAQDDIVICPPTFGMYQVYADIQAAGIQRIALQGAALALPVDDIVAAWTPTTKLVFVTTPNNPTGHSLDVGDIELLANALDGSGVIVIDAAYIEFGAPESVMALRKYPHVVILRTLSKAYGLAGARCGSLIADPELIGLIEKVMPPYAVPTPTVEAATAALVNEAFAVMPQRIASLCAERRRVASALRGLPGVRRVWPSDANFLLVTFDDPQRALAQASAAGYLLRDFSEQPETTGCIRITIGSTADNDALLSALGNDPETQR
ncbi:MAG: histidinol-phosphate transaminase [Pseudomonadota bacterium]